VVPAVGRKDAMRRTLSKKIVAAVAVARPERLLSVTRGATGRVDEHLATLAYRADDPKGERRAWRAHRAALGGR